MDKKMEKLLKLLQDDAKLTVQELAKLEQTTYLLIANTMSEIAMFVAKRLAPIDGVLSTATHFILTKYKDGGVDFVTDYDEIDERGSNLCD